MKPVRGVIWASALVLLGGGTETAHAAWCNVFQVCCNQCGHVSASGYDPCCNPCPQPVCTTRYVRRCYYQPVTCYQTKTYYEPVTSYQTRYYYQPVTSYRYSCYFDPCTCSYQPVACPVTCYRLRAQCCPVQSWVQRCCQVPVTTYRQVCCYEPVTTCCTPPAPVCCPTTCPNGSVAQAPSAPTAPPGAAAPPAVTENQPVPGVREYGEPGREGSGSPLYDRYYRAPDNRAPDNRVMPPANGSAYRQLPPRLPVTPPPPAPAAPPPTVKLERIVAAPGGHLQGQVVRNDNLPEPGIRLTFVSAAEHGPRQLVTTDAAGNFRVTLASGGWLVYLTGADNRPLFHSNIVVRDNDNRRITLVSR